MRTLDAIEARISEKGDYERPVADWMAPLLRVPLLNDILRNAVALPHARFNYDVARVKGCIGVDNRSLFFYLLNPLILIAGLAIVASFNGMGLVATGLFAFPFMPVLTWILLFCLVYMGVMLASTLIVALGVLHGTIDHARGTRASDLLMLGEHPEVSGQNMFSPLH